MTEPDRYQYWYKGTAKQFEARVVADLDCDNAGTTEFRITGRVQSGGPVVDIAISDQAD